jgi:hypothetical protein
LTASTKTGELRDVTGFRGEKIVELCLTDYQTLSGPLFRPGFLGDKWPAVDFYVELRRVRAKRLYFFCQAKSTTRAPSSQVLKIKTERRDIERLLQVPAPTYILGVHEPTRRVFIKAIHSGTPRKGISSIPLAYELNEQNLKLLHDEVRAYWSSSVHKPSLSNFD